MRVLVCGGRDYRDRHAVCRVLDALYGEEVITAIIHGGASGADASASYWAAMSEPVENLCFKPDWKTHGRAAGPIRNQRMLDEGKPDLVLAFPGGRGTADMVRRAKAAGIRVQEVTR